ncbi:MAG: PAS domain-containing protein, partial [Candidatus Sumerlaeota bacterium]|nr:PAS domain-containing protein [Candidatus Sumerlaeota bacterium]
MENDATTEMVHMLESMVSSLNELLAVQEKVVSEQSEKLKELLESLQRGETLLNEVGAMARVGGWELDVKTKEMRWTKETYRIHDISEDEKYDLSKAVLFFDLPDRSTLETALQRCMEKGEPFDLELLFTSAKGRHLWTRAMGRAVNVDGEVVKLTGTFQDITEQHKAEEALRTSEIRSRTLLENLPQKIFLKDRNLVYISCNENYARDLKIKPEEIAGKTDYDFHPKDLAEKYRADDKRIMESGKTEDIEEKYIQNGQVKFVHTIKTLVKDEQGNVTGILGIFWDITEQKRAEETC